MSDTEPTTVTDARRVVRQYQRAIAVYATFIGLGWLPLVFIDVASPLAGPFKAAYLIALIVGTGALIWGGHRSGDAITLVKTWERSQANKTLERAIAGEARVGAAVDTGKVDALMGRIRTHLQADARALRAAEQAYARLQALRAEEAAATEVLESLGAGAGREKLDAARQRVVREAEEVESLLATLYATLLTVEEQPTFDGLKETLLQLEAEVEVSQEAEEALLRARRAAKQTSGM